jgi:hypothetical protein
LLDRKLRVAEKGHKKGAKRVLFAPLMVSMKSAYCFGMNGGDDETRTRDLCRDSSNSPAAGSSTYKTGGKLSHNFGEITLVTSTV